jgi:hypothetical protein
MAEHMADAKKTMMSFQMIRYYPCRKVHNDESDSDPGNETEGGSEAPLVMLRAENC